MLRPLNFTFSFCALSSCVENCFAFPPFAFPPPPLFLAPFPPLRFLVDEWSGLRSLLEPEPEPVDCTMAAAAKVAGATKCTSRRYVSLHDLSSASFKLMPSSKTCR
eukprot:9520551-Karenia_brevis.AAC.1